MWVCSGMNGCLRAATPKPSFPNHCFEGLEKEKASVQQRYGIALEEFIPAQTFPFNGCISQILCGFVHIQLLKKRTETRNQSWDVMCWKANCNSLLVCSAAEWQRIAAGILRFCFHWKREWQTAEITKVIFFKHSIYWITSQIQSLTFSDFSTHLFTFSANGLLPSGSWRSTEKSGLYFMACSQWTCSISFRDKFCFYNFHLGKVIKGSLRVDVSNLRLKINSCRTHHLVNWSQQLTEWSWLHCKAALEVHDCTRLKHHDIPLPAWNPNAWWKLLESMDMIQSMQFGHSSPKWCPETGSFFHPAWITIRSKTDTIFNLTTEY